MRFIRHFKLETMCLNVIINRIEFYVTNSELPEMHIQFLYRAYSGKIYQLLKRNALVEEKYIQWLLTPHWKHVTLDSHDSYSDGILQRLKVMGTAITSLNLKNSLASEAILTAIICTVPNLTHLDLSGTVCSDKTLRCIRRLCKYVSHLDLADCGSVSDRGMKHLYTSNDIATGNDVIKNLDITQTSVTKKGVASILKHFPFLQILKYENLSVILYELYKSDIPKDCSEIGSYNITEFVHFHSERINLIHVLEVWTVMCPKVTSVCIIDVTSKNHLELCSKFTHLKELRLLPPHEYEELNSKNISSLFRVRGEMLTTLCMLHMTISVDILAKTCRNMRSIFFHNMIYKDFVEENNKELYNLRNLETLVVKHADFAVAATFKSISLLLSAGNHLTKLCIKSANSFKEEVTDMILNSTDNLQVIDVSFTDIKLPSLLRFFNCATIHKIYADSCINIPTEGRSPLSKYVNVDYENTCSWQLEFDNDIDDDKFIPYEFWWRLL